MVQEAAERLLARRIPQAEKRAIVGLVNLAADGGLIDPDTGNPFTRIEQDTPIEGQMPVRLLRLAISEFKTSPRTPELVDRTFQAIWQDRQRRLNTALRKLGEPANVTFEVLPCDYTAEELEEVRSKGNRIGYVPENLATQEARYLLGIMFPKMGSHSVRKGNSVTNEGVPRWGWFDYEAAIDAPYTGTTEEQLRKIFEDQDREGLNATEYAIAGQDSKLFTNHYLDEFGTGKSTYVRLLSSRRGGLVARARFDAAGLLYVDWGLGPRLAGDLLGGRSRGVKKS